MTTNTDTPTTTVSTQDLDLVCDVIEILLAYGTTERAMPVDAKRRIHQFRQMREHHRAAATTIDLTGGDQE